MQGGYTGDSFFWEDNTDFRYTNWAPGKPGNFLYTVNRIYPHFI